MNYIMIKIMNKLNNVLNKNEWNIILYKILLIRKNIKKFYVIT